MGAWYGVDLDGTLARYASSDDSNKIGEPVPLMLARVKTWLDVGMEVRIVTARVSGGPQQADFVLRQRHLIQDWCEKHLGQRLPVTCRKDFAMVALYDDRCVQVMPNSGILLEDHVIRLNKEVEELKAKLAVYEKG